MSSRCCSRTRRPDPMSPTCCEPRSTLRAPRSVLKENRHAEMEDACSARVVGRRRRSRLGFCSAAERDRILRTAHLHGPTGKEGRASRPFLKAERCKSSEGLKYQWWNMDPAKKATGDRRERREHVHLHARLS